MLISQIDHRLRWDRDILRENDSNRLKEIKRKAQEFIGSNPNNDGAQTFIDGSLKELNQIPPKKASTVKEWLELLVVVFGVVMGARALFLQPFKIPTGSMQPTLHGINFEPEKTVNKNIFRRIFDYVNYSHRYVDIGIEESGHLTNVDTKGGSQISRRNPFFFFPYTKLRIGDKTYNLPGDPDAVLKYINLPARSFEIDSRGYRAFLFNEGEILARGYLELGDHLFVDRVRFNFVEPKRGDITVFITDGIKDVFGKPLRGRFFIKRLVGLPGDELKIANRKLYVKEQGKKKFVLVDGSMHRAFDRMYSFKGGYKGYSQPQYNACQYLKDENTPFKLGKDEYFMLGDNSENSQDSRFWGVVPRRNIVGRANFVYWPFSRRWGFADSVEPEHFESLPTKN